MPWATRGLRVVTTGYPHTPDDYGGSFRAAVSPLPGARWEPDMAQVCPTGAITEHDGVPRLDHGRCIVCGRCVRRFPRAFRSDAAVETAALLRDALVVPPLRETDEALARVRAALARRVRRLRRSVHIRHVDAGSDGTEEWEIAALLNPVYDVHRLGIFFTASPRHADILLVTGAGSAGMLRPLRITVEATAAPFVVVACGTDAISGGLLGRGYATRGGVSEELAVDVWIPGSPPSPFSILHGLLLALGRFPKGGPA